MNNIHVVKYKIVQKMTPDAKKCLIDDQAMEEEEDRISNLPSELISCILDRMLIGDAARTSILSKTWKNIWETHPHIVFPISRSCLSIISKKAIEVYRSKFLGAVNSILLAHRGPILKFVLYMPPYLNLHESPYPHLWIKQLSEKGVRVLELGNSTENPTNNIPSYFFSCSELTVLVLVNWKLDPPPKIRGFRNLISILLRQVTFTADMSFGTQVQKFHLIDCAGIEHLDSQLTNHSKNLKSLYIIRRVVMENRYALAFDYNPFTNIKKSFNLHRLLGNMPSIKSLLLNAPCLMFLDPGLTLHNQLTTTMENLKTLMLLNVAFNDMYMISNVFCLLRSMPILEHLMIAVGPDIKSWSHIKLTAEQYLESSDCANMIMNQLQTVLMRGVMGSRAEILFIKLLLASSPSLKSMTLERKTTMNDPKEDLRIVRELLQLPRKSPVKIFWS